MAYGHSAIRLVDKRLGVDVVFNYGTFDFNTPFFYLKFLNGTLDYMLSTSEYSRFLRTYQREGREVVESELILSNSQKQEVERLLIENSRPVNRFYRYDFFFDNCATRIRDIVFKVADAGASEMLFDTENATFRDCIHEKVGPNEWSGFGIDIILGVRADKNVSLYDKAMLPDYLESLFRKASLTSEGKVILKKTVEPATPAVISPILYSVLFLAVIVLVSVIEALRRKWFAAFDVALAVVCSLLSILLWYLWIVSDIKITSYNLNVLWASFLYVPMVYAIVKRKAKFIRVVSWLNVAQMSAYFTLVAIGVQYASVPILVIALALVVRNLALLRRI